MEIDKVYNRYLCLNCSQHDCVYKLLTSGLCLICEKKVCICDDFINEDWRHSILKSFSLPIPSSSSDFDVFTPPKSIAKPLPKTYVVVVATLVNEQIEY
jgi:hypothetical protein